MYLGADRRGRLLGEMRWRVGPLIVAAAMAAVPAASGAAWHGHVSSLKVSVTPHSGSGRTRFTVSFRSAVTTGRLAHDIYRVTASAAGHSGCQSTVSAVAPFGKAGSKVRVVLAPSASRRWCAGVFHGQVWDVITQPCPLAKACPAIEPIPQVVGKFTFRVSNG
jgi:hypothetical protein